MMSITRAALEIYEAERKYVEEIVAENGIPCKVNVPFKFKGKGLEAKLTPRRVHTHNPPDSLELTTDDYRVMMGNRFEKDHELVGFLLKGIDWKDGCNPKTIRLDVGGIKDLDIYSSRIKQIHGEEGTEILDYKRSRNLSIRLPVENIDAFDTIFHLYTGREPTLDNFFSNDTIEMYCDPTDGIIDATELSPYIKDVSELPERHAKIEVELRENGVELPRNEIVGIMRDYRNRGIKRHREAMNKIRKMTGTRSTNIACAIKETSFWRYNGVEVLGMVSGPHWFPPPLLNSARIKFAEPLQIDKIGYYIRGRFFGGAYSVYKLDVDVGDYLEAESILDLVDKSELSLFYKGFVIKENEITRSNVRSWNVKKMLKLAEKISYVV